ncbi:MAG: YfbU family protein [Minisyncoccales bacterium]
METNIKLTSEQRIMLILLHEILAKLNSDPEYHLKAIEILQNGYYEMYGNEHIGPRLSEPLSFERMNYVDDVLDMFSRIQRSYKNLSEEEKKKVDAKKIIFEGFDANNEVELLCYAEFTIEKMKRWDDIDRSKDLNTHNQTRYLYSAMLKAMPKREGQMLSADEINKIVNPII